MRYAYLAGKKTPKKLKSFWDICDIIPETWVFRPSTLRTTPDPSWSRTSVQACNRILVAWLLLLAQPSQQHNSCKPSKLLWSLRCQLCSHPGFWKSVIYTCFVSKSENLKWRDIGHTCVLVPSSLMPIWVALKFPYWSMMHLARLLYSALVELLHQSTSLPTLKSFNFTQSCLSKKAREIYWILLWDFCNF